MAVLMLRPHITQTCNGVIRMNWMRPEQSKADLEARLIEAKQDRKAANADLEATKEYIRNLHTSCDFIMENYDFRKTARATERDALMNAKAALQGADVDA